MRAAVGPRDPGAFKLVAKRVFLGGAEARRQAFLKKEKTRPPGLEGCCVFLRGGLALSAVEKYAPRRGLETHGAFKLVAERVFLEARKPGAELI